MKNDGTAIDKSMRANTGNSLVPDFSSWMNGTNQAMESWAQSSASMMKGAVDLAQEIMTFSQSRLDADTDAWKAVTACRNPADFFECQRRFTETATAQYLDEASKLNSRIMAIMGGAAAPARQERASTRASGNHKASIS